MSDKQEESAPGEQPEEQQDQTPAAQSAQDDQPAEADE